MNARVLVASVIGSAIEWFDFFLYGTLTPLVFSKLFFPAGDPMVSVLLAYLSFSLTFFVRPISSALFSFIGDRVGRKGTLILTLLLMGSATALIGLLPTYERVGTAAPVALTILRLIQGLGIGGEWGGALVLVYEYAPNERKGFFGSLPQTGVTLGMLLSTLSVSGMSLLPEAAFMSWGWRVPFLLSAGLAFLGLWMRKGVDESPEFKAIKTGEAASHNPLAETLRRHWPAVLTAVGAKIAETSSFYVFTVFVVSYATGVLGLARIDVLDAITAGAILSTLTIPLAGWLADRIGRRTVFISGCILLAAFAAPYFKLMSLRTPAAITIATAIALGVSWPLLTAVLGTLFSEAFPAEVRYTGVSLGYQIGAALAGGTAPLIATYLLFRSHNDWRPVAFYVAGTAVISAFAVLYGVQAPNLSRREAA